MGFSFAQPEIHRDAFTYGDVALAQRTRGDYSDEEDTLSGVQSGCLHIRIEMRTPKREAKTKQPAVPSLWAVGPKVHRSPLVLRKAGSSLSNPNPDINTSSWSNEKRVSGSGVGKRASSFYNNGRDRPGRRRGSRSTRITRSYSGTKTPVLETPLPDSPADPLGYQKAPLQGYSKQPMSSWISAQDLERVYKKSQVSVTYTAKRHMMEGGGDYFEGSNKNGPASATDTPLERMLEDERSAFEGRDRSGQLSVKGIPLGRMVVDGANDFGVGDKSGQLSVKGSPQIGNTWVGEGLALGESSSIDEGKSGWASEPEHASVKNPLAGQRKFWQPKSEELLQQSQGRKFPARMVQTEETTARLRIEREIAEIEEEEEGAEGEGQKEEDKVSVDYQVEKAEGGKEGKEENEGEFGWNRYGTVQEERKATERSSDREENGKTFVPKHISQRNLKGLSQGIFTPVRAAGTWQSADATGMLGQQKKGKRSTILVVAPRMGANGRNGKQKLQIRQQQHTERLKQQQQIQKQRQLALETQKHQQRQQQQQHLKVKQQQQQQQLKLGQQQQQEQQLKLRQQQQQQQQQQNQRQLRQRLQLEQQLQRLTQEQVEQEQRLRQQQVQQEQLKQHLKQAQQDRPEGPAVDAMVGRLHVAHRQSSLTAKEKKAPKTHLTAADAMVGQFVQANRGQGKGAFTITTNDRALTPPRVMHRVASADSSMAGFDYPSTPGPPMPCGFPTTSGFPSMDPTKSNGQVGGSWPETRGMPPPASQQCYGTLSPHSMQGQVPKFGEWKMSGGGVMRTFSGHFSGLREQRQKTMVRT